MCVLTHSFQQRHLMRLLYLTKQKDRILWAFVSIFPSNADAFCSKECLGIFQPKKWAKGRRSEGSYTGKMLYFYQLECILPLTNLCCCATQLFLRTLSHWLILQHQKAIYFIFGLINVICFCVSYNQMLFVPNNTR